MKFKILIITLFLLILPVNAFASTPQVVTLSRNNTASLHYTGTSNFTRPVDVDLIRLSITSGSTSEVGTVSLYDINNVLLGSENFPFSDGKLQIREVDYKDVYKVVVKYPRYSNTSYSIYEKSLGLVSNYFDESKSQYVFEFNFDPILVDNILVKNNKDEIIDYTLNKTGKFIKLNFKNLQVGTYYITSFNVGNIEDEDTIEISSNEFTIDEPLKFMEKIFDKINNILTYVFNKDIKVEKQDISFLNENGEQQEFTYVVEKNKLIIFLNKIRQGIYNIKPLKVTSLDENEQLTNIPFQEIKINGIQLIQKNFGNFISSSLQNLILTFDRKIESSSIVLKNVTDDIVIDTQTIITDNKLIIDYQPFKPDTSYILTIQSLNDTEGNELLNPMIFEFKTIVSTGDVTSDIIISQFLNIFTEAQNKGIKIVVLAIGIGIIFIISRWLWNKTKLWLKKS